jgi:leader peptidase (prepilin peptidase)/N-methyltransferase
MSLELLQTGFAAVQVLFVFAVGACVGSLVNVLVYRLPLGLSVVTPPSRCPSCQTRLTWRENIPILGWLVLRGRCRFCKSPISPEYPLVELVVAALFTLVYALWFLPDPGDTLLGAPVGKAPPEWALNGIRTVWPLLVAVLVLVGALVAMTLVDAKTCTIPLVLAWTPAVVGAAAHVGLSAYLSITGGRLWSTAPGWTWAIASPGAHGWWWVGSTLGGLAGLVIANGLLALGLLRRSFEDYEAWEEEARKHDAQQAGARNASEPAEEAIAPASPPDPGSGVDRDQPPAPPGASGAADGPEDPTHYWIRYPHARREIVKELAFLGPVVGFAVLGGTLAKHSAGPWGFNPDTGVVEPAAAVPLWLDAACGAGMGFLIGGGVVWAVRIAGTLAFGKEAMGLGDVHLMAAVGACLGWIDSTLAFFLAAFVGLAWAVLGRLASGAFARSMPYGPFLAVATLLVLVLKPALEVGLSRLLPAAGPINIP